MTSDEARRTALTAAALVAAVVGAAVDADYRGGAVVTGVVAVPLVPYGYGFYQLPTVVLLALAARRDR